jgi:hypothetical protein
MCPSFQICCVAHTCSQVTTHKLLTKELTEYSWIRPHAKHTTLQLHYPTHIY